VNNNITFFIGFFTVFLVLAANGPRPRAVAVSRTEFSPLKIEFLREK